MALTRLYRVKETAALLGLQPSTVRKLILQRRIAVCRPTRRAVRVPETEIARIQHDGLSPRRGEACNATREARGGEAK